MVYEKRNAPILPYRVFQIQRALGFGSTVSLNYLPGDGETIRGIHEKKDAGSRVPCIQIAGPNTKREVCVDPNTGLIQDGHIRSELTPIGSKWFPRSILMKENGTTVVQIQITELDTNESHGVGLFDQPEGASARPGCMNPSSGRKVKDAIPQYPVEEKLASHEGVVAIYGLIDQFGVPQKLQVVKSATPGLDESALAAVRQWRYSPATCSGKPVEVETVITVRFTLQR